jgi:hypothetical protein
MAKKVVEINKGTAYSTLESKSKRNEICKDYNALTDSIRAEVRGVFFY